MSAKNEKYCLKLEKCECSRTGLPNLSFEEQYAGFDDVDGKKVYTKYFDLGKISLPSDNEDKHIPHGIENLKEVIKMDTAIRCDIDGEPVWKTSVSITSSILMSLIEIMVKKDCIRIIQRRGTSPYNWFGKLWVFYTCTDR